MIEIKKLDGLAPELYEWIGPLVMNPVVLRHNNNYPYKTSKNFVWYILLTEGKITAFIPLERLTERQMRLDNYYISATGGREKQLRLLLCAVLRDYRFKCEIVTLAHKRDVDVFVSLDFVVEKELVYYCKLVFKCL